MYPRSIQKLIDLFSKFPGVGPKTAARFVFYLTMQDKEELEGLAEAIGRLKTSLKICTFCLRFFDASTGSTQGGKGSLCDICSNGSRNKTLLCIVEKETDLVSIENSKAYNGLYFILGGAVVGLKKEDLEKLKIQDLIERIKAPAGLGLTGASFKEIVLAINPTVEGEATILFLERKLKDLNKKITRLGRGLPMGGELEYADRETLFSAFKSRR